MKQLHDSVKHLIVWRKMTMRNYQLAKIKFPPGEFTIFHGKIWVNQDHLK